MGQDKKEIIPGLVPQKDGSYAVFIEIPGGACPSSRDLRALSEISEELSCKVHVTTAQKFMLLNLTRETGRKALEKLSQTNLYAKKAGDISQPRVCVGRPYCKFALQETFSFSDTIIQRIGRQPVAKKLKVGIAGCPACCSWANVLDVGFVGIKRGFQVFVGGHGGSKPVPGQNIALIKTHDEGVELLSRIAALFTENVKIKSRLDRAIKKIGMERFLREIGL